MITPYTINTTSDIPHRRAYQEHDFTRLLAVRIRHPSSIINTRVLVILLIDDPPSVYTRKHRRPSVESSPVCRTPDKAGTRSCLRFLETRSPGRFGLGRGLLSSGWPPLCSAASIKRRTKNKEKTSKWQKGSRDKRRAKGCQISKEAT